ncbi:MAG: hypothetical protein LUE87_09370, partial [Lachnospiraceae bacterium]|nr:hypothetical protein [Lachnospiraceae bacterium]
MGIDVEAVKRWLRRYGDLDAELDFAYTRLDELDETMISVKSPTLSDMPHGARAIDKTERYIIRKERILAEIQNLTDELIGLEAE